MDSFTNAIKKENSMAAKKKQDLVIPEIGAIKPLLADAHPNHEHHLCHIISLRNMRTAAKLAKDAQYICFLCGRSAKNAKNLCQPVKI
jgi:hypothetical protein